MVKIGDMEEDRADAKEEYSIVNMDSKKDAVDEEPTENAPLKAEDAEVTISETKENDISGGGDGTHAQKGLRVWLKKSGVKWWIAIVLAFLLIGGILAVTLLTFNLEIKTSEVVDDVPRLMTLWPRPNGPDNLIHFRHGSWPLEGKIWPNLTAQLDELLEGYKQELLTTSSNLRQCYGSEAPEGASCFFDISRLAPFCIKANNYGYHDGRPCIFLQFSNITGWRPEPYTTADIENNDDIPDTIRRKYSPDIAYIHCQGNTEVDKENLGQIDYYPDPGYPVHFFPYENQTDYMPPLVAIRPKHPSVGIAMGITCRLWARNVNHTDDAVPNPSIHFNLLIE